MKAPGKGFEDGLSLLLPGTDDATNTTEKGAAFFRTDGAEKFLIDLDHSQVPLGEVVVLAPRICLAGFTEIHLNSYLPSSVIS